MICCCVGFVGCGKAEEDPKDNKTCTGKCDTPTDKEDYNWKDACTARRKDALEGNRQVFTPSAVRWGCADVDGVNARNQDDRGQEYCEYFAMVQLPDLDNDTLSDKVEHLGRNYWEEADLLTTSAALELDDDQFDWYDDHSDDVVGHCIFTSWHGDAGVLDCEQDDSCPTVLGQEKLSANVFQMKLGANTNAAARELLKDCMGGVSSYATGADDPVLDDAFMRGCRLADDTYQTGWRISDSSLCAASVRLTECGCGVEGIETIDELAQALVPKTSTQEEQGWTLRGFPLGGWAGADKLPSGCKYVEEEGTLKTIVKCDIYGSDVLDNIKDLKGMCRSRYGENVVVYVPLPDQAISCQPPEDGQYNTCSEQPWVVQP